MGGAKVACTGLVQYLEVDAISYCRVVGGLLHFPILVYIRLAGRNGEQQGKFACMA